MRPGGFSATVAEGKLMQMFSRSNFTNFAAGLQGDRMALNPMRKTVLADEYWPAVHKLFCYLTENHWNGAALLGPDVGIRLNYRIGRFLKNYLPRSIGWNDSYCYIQAQG